MIQGDRGLQGERGMKGTKGDMGDPGVPGEEVSKIVFLKWHFNMQTKEIYLRKKL